MPARCRSALCAAFMIDHLAGGMRLAAGKVATGFTGCGGGIAVLCGEDRGKSGRQGEAPGIPK